MVAASLRIHSRYGATWSVMESPAKTTRSSSLASRSIGVAGASNTTRVVEGISAAGATVVAPDATVVEGAVAVATVVEGAAVEATVVEGAAVEATVVEGAVVEATVVEGAVVVATVVEVLAADRGTNSDGSEPQEKATAKITATANDVGGLRTSRLWSAFLIHQHFASFPDVSRPARGLPERPRVTPASVQRSAS